MNKDLFSSNQLLNQELQQLNDQLTAEWTAFQRVHKMVKKPAQLLPAYQLKNHSRMWSAKDWARHSIDANTKDRNKG